jgi:hypothetical protein
MSCSNEIPEGIDGCQNEFDYTDFSLDFDTMCISIYGMSYYETYN